MKKIAVALLLAAIFAAFGIAANSYINSKPTDNTKKTNITSGLSVRKPDADYLAKYGFESFSSDLPVIMLDTGSTNIVKETASIGAAAIFDSKSGNNNIMSQPDTLLPCTVKLRGASSYTGFDKPQYRIKFYKNTSYKKSVDEELFGMGKNSEWVLYGPFLDRSLARNFLCYGLMRDVMEWAPDSRYCEVFENGKYMGVYVAVEPVTNGESRLRLSKFGLSSGSTAFIVKRDRIGTEYNPIETWGKLNGKTTGELSIAYPTNDKLTDKSKKWISNRISDFEKVLYSKNFADPNIGYAKYIDADSFAQYIVLNEVVMNHDAGNLSTYAYAELGGKIKLACWDYNNSFNNYQWFSIDVNEILSTQNSWLSRLLQDRSFIDRVISEYKKLRFSVLDTSSVLNRIDLSVLKLQSASKRNFAVWGYTFKLKLLTKDANENIRDPSSYEEAVTMLKDTVTKRLTALDTALNGLYKNCVN